MHCLNGGDESASKRSIWKRNWAQFSARRKRIKEYLGNFLMLVTALNPHIRYGRAAKLSPTASHDDLRVPEAALKLGFVMREELASRVRPEEMIDPLEQGL